MTRSRLYAILVMVLGAVGFAVGLLVFEGQVGCLALSTLITLGGLGININARRKGLVAEKNGGAPVHPRQEKSARWARSRAPRGLRRAAPKTNNAPRAVPVQAPVTAQAGPARSTVTLEQIPASLIERVTAILEAQGAVVTLESARSDRGILRVVTGEGQRYVALIVTGGVPSDVAAVRSLAALVQGSGSSRGYLIAGKGFTPQAYDYAEGRTQLRLVSGDELDELGI